MTKQTIPRAERLIAALDVATPEEAKTLVHRLGDSVSFYRSAWNCSWPTGSST